MDVYSIVSWLEGRKSSFNHVTRSIRLVSQNIASDYR